MEAEHTLPHEEQVFELPAAAPHLGQELCMSLDGGILCRLWRWFNRAGSSTLMDSVVGEGGREQPGRDGGAKVELSLGNVPRVLAKLHPTTLIRASTSNLRNEPPSATRSI